MLALRRQSQVDLSVSSRPAWPTEPVPGQPPKLHRETLSQRPEENKESYARSYTWILHFLHFYNLLLHTLKCNSISLPVVR